MLLTSLPTNSGIRLTCGNTLYRDIRGRHCEDSGTCSVQAATLDEMVCASPQWSVVHLDVEPPSFFPPHQAAAPSAEKTPQTNQVQSHHASWQQELLWNVLLVWCVRGRKPRKEIFVQKGMPDRAPAQDGILPCILLRWGSGDGSTRSLEQYPQRQLLSHWASHTGALGSLIRPLTGSQ